MDRPVRHHDERGLSETTQWVLLAPLLLVVVLGIVQSALVLHGRSVAANAALAGAEAAALSGGSSAQGGRTARDVADRGGLTQTRVDVDLSDGLVRVVVTGQVDSFVPLPQNHVSASAEVPAEVPR